MRSSASGTRRVCKLCEFLQATLMMETHLIGIFDANDELAPLSGLGDEIVE